MKLLLRQDVPKLGMVGDVVEVSTGYARNYLIPHRLAIEPTQANMKAIEAARREAAERRAKMAADRKAAAERLDGVEVTISAAANEVGHLYGSVGRREIARALTDEGHAVSPDMIEIAEPFRQLDSVTVPVRFDEELVSNVKVWIVREKISGEDTEADEDADDAEPQDADDDASGEHAQRDVDE